MRMSSLNQCGRCSAYFMFEQPPSLVHHFLCHDCRSPSHIVNCCQCDYGEPIKPICSYCNLKLCNANRYCKQCQYCICCGFCDVCKYCIMCRNVSYNLGDCHNCSDRDFHNSWLDYGSVECNGIHNKCANLHRES